MSKADHRQVAAVWGRHAPCPDPSSLLPEHASVGTDACSRGYAINSKGQVVGGSSDCHTFLQAYIWENGGPMIDLNTLVSPASGLTLTQAIYINNRSEIAGTGVVVSENSVQIETVALARFG